MKYLMLLLMLSSCGPSAIDIVKMCTSICEAQEGNFAGYKHVNGVITCECRKIK